MAVGVFPAAPVPSASYYAHDTGEAALARIRDQLNAPVKFVGLGETIEGIEPFDPEMFVEAPFAE